MTMNETFRVQQIVKFTHGLFGILQFVKACAAIPLITILFLYYMRNWNNEKSKKPSILNCMHMYVSTS